MAKFGKNYRILQIAEWSTHYFNYKKLKQKIKAIIQKINKDINEGTFINDINTSIMPTLNVIPIENKNSSLNLNELSVLYARKYGKDLEQFVQILNEELNKFYSFYIILEKELYKKVNNHLYTQTNYQSYNLYDIYMEFIKLNKTTFLIKCLNSFLYDNMNALKNILKKFDNKLGKYCGKIEYKYISSQIYLKKDNKLKYLLQSKSIDEALTICESNLKELFKYYLQNQNRLEYVEPNIDTINEQKKEMKTNFIDLNEEKNKNIILFQDLNKDNIKLKIVQKKQEILKTLKEADEFIYFKMQYGDWFYFQEEIECPIKQREKFLENAIFNPILSSTFKNDNIITKFISNKDCLYEIKKSQTPISSHNKKNIAFILIQTFFYNTLITCIYPLLFIYIKGKKYEYIYAFLIIALTYLTSFFFMIIYHHTKIEDIKFINVICYILCIFGSLFYILSNIYIDYDNDYIVFGFILISRIFIGLGNNIMTGKKYISLYTPRYYIGKISLLYLVFQILGMAFGPFIGLSLTYIPEKEFWKLRYNCYNCIGWYGFVGAILLIILNGFLFTKPTSSKFLNFKDLYISMKSSHFKDDIDDTMDKEYYDMKQELINNNKEVKNDIYENDDNNDDEEVIITNDNNNDNNDEEYFTLTERKSTKNKLTMKNNFSLLRSQKNLNAYNDIESINTTNKKDKNHNKKKRTISGNESDLNALTLDLNKNINNNKNIDDPLSIAVQKEEETETESDYICSDFNKINMIPRTLDDIIRKEKTTFGYINHNLLMMFLLLFFNNLIKENYIAFISYYITNKETFVENSEEEYENGKLNIDLDKVRLTCLLTGAAYISELISLFFILPFHKINLKFKKYTIILMALSIILMLTLSVFITKEINTPYYIIISFLIFITMSLEVISSSYLSYLLPSQWKFKNIRAGALTVYIMTFGKIIGILFCLISFRDSTWNYFGLTAIVGIFYTSMIIYLCKSTNLRIKAICRIIHMRKLEELIL